MTHPWRSLVPALEAIDLAALVGEPDALRAAMRERHDILSQLLRADSSSLEASERQALKARLAVVQERDRALIAHLNDLREQTRQQLAQTDNGKRAMSGYKSMVSETPPPVRRIG